MKRKQVNASPKSVKQAKVSKKATHQKIAQEVVEESDEEEVPVQKVVVTKKSPIKNTVQVKEGIRKNGSSKVVKKAAPPKKAQEVEESDEEEVPVRKVSKKLQNRNAVKVKEAPKEDEDEEGDEEEDDSMGADDDDDDEEEDDAMGAEDDTDEEEAEDDDEEDDDNEDDDAVEAEEEDDDSSEEAIGTEEPTIPSKVKSGQIPPTVPVTKIVHIKNLPKNCKQINIVEVFAKYGAIDQINIFTTPSGTQAKIAYKTEKAAIAALEDNKKVKVLDSIVYVNMKNGTKTLNALKRDRTVHVKNIKPETTREQISEHFESCGEVESVKTVTKFNTFAYVVFADKSSMPAALKLHNSILNGSNIKITEYTENREIQVYNERLTIMLKNKQSFESIEVSKIESIFSKCGEIALVEILCKKNVLAFVTFKTEEAAQKALKMSGKTVKDIELDIELYSPIRQWTSIHVLNLLKDVTEEELLNHFSKAGEIVNIIRRPSYAMIRFKDSDGYCKSFLLNESFIRGQIIFIEPHSTRKQALYKNKGYQKKGFIRQPKNVHSVFKAKKLKKN